MRTHSKKLLLLLAVTLASDNAFAADPQAQAQAQAKVARDQIKGVAVVCTTAALQSTSEGIVRLLQLPEKQVLPAVGKAGFHIAFTEISKIANSLYCMNVFASRKGASEEKAICAQSLVESEARTLIKGMKISACFTAADSILSGNTAQYLKDIDEGAAALEKALNLQQEKFQKMGVDPAFVGKVAKLLADNYSRMAKQEFEKARGAINFLQGAPPQARVKLQEQEKTELEIQLAKKEDAARKSISEAVTHLTAWLTKNGNTVADSK